MMFDSRITPSMTVDFACRAWRAAVERSRARFGIAAVCTAGWVTFAREVSAQAMPGGTPDARAGAVARSGFLAIFDRLDTLGLVLVVGAAFILVLLMIRIGLMVRGEKRPMKAAQAPRRGGTPPRMMDDAIPLERTTTALGLSDWGQDQNKRSAEARAEITIPSSHAGVTSLESAVTQWTASEVHRAADFSRGANESMGKPPDQAPSLYRTAHNPYYRGDPNPQAAMEVVEVADTLMQAELLVQLGDPKQAMTLLANHIRETERPGPAVWLMLLDLYQTTGRKQQYETLAQGFSTLFNAQVPPWAKTKEIAARDLESYPQVMMKLHMNWDKPGGRAQLESLLADDRGGSRQGFSLGAYRDLLFLLEIVGELEKMTQEENEREEIKRKLQQA
jgi:hypothetical protein